MLYRMLAVGDVGGEAGLRHLEKQLRPLRRLRDIAFVSFIPSQTANHRAFTARIVDELRAIA